MNSVEQLHIHVQKNPNKPANKTLVSTKKLKMELRSKYKNKNHKSSRTQWRRKSLLLWLGKGFLLWHQEHDLWKKKKINWTFSKLKMVVLQNSLLREWKDKPQTARNHSQVIFLTKDFYSKYIKRSYNSAIRKQTNYKMAKRSEQTLHWRKNTEGKKVYEKILSITSQGNTMKTTKRPPCTLVTTEWLEKFNIKSGQGAGWLGVTAWPEGVWGGVDVGESVWQKKNLCFAAMLNVHVGGDPTICLLSYLQIKWKDHTQENLYVKCSYENTHTHETSAQPRCYSFDKFINKLA